ncbi:Glutathione S-transferase [Caenispirillum salinarum AK4]|uniref:glutathione transferase n=1 Tax=Caenispirillum salinarum AK4 TaxID=1238182 RepID=K9HCB3_9PROT|nr:glutathione S-transferase family protein [Caenispirillum salinarum]EKV28148.1 Glutathione S-transferase [Caenispirillum salinarum AK4]
MTTDPRYTLISFSVCPFVMRARLVLTLKGVPHTTTMIDVADKPDWFLALSPLGKVPVLRVDGAQVLFESQVICEYLDETTPGSLHSDDPLERARDRAWIEFATSLILTGFGHLTAQDDRAQAQTRPAFDRMLANLEGRLGNGPFFNGERFMMIDAAYAPFFVQMDAVKRIADVDLLASAPGLRHWSDALLAHDAVQAVVPASFAEALADVLRSKGSAYVAPAPAA